MILDTFENELFLFFETLNKNLYFWREQEALFEALSFSSLIQTPPRSCLELQRVGVFDVDRWLR